MAPNAALFNSLMARAHSGDESALAELARTYEAEVRIVAHVLLGPALRPYLDSIDLVQSVHKSLLVGLRNDKFDISSPEKLIALALTIVRRKVARQWRHMRRQTRLESTGSSKTNLAELIASLGSPEADPASAAQYNDMVRHVCGKLSETERRVIDLRLQGLSTADVARNLDLDPDVLRVQLSRLRQRLRKDGVLTEWL